jgi:hypothetical protein
MNLLSPLAGHTVNDHKTNDSTRRELQTECTLDKMDEYRRNRLLHLQRMPQNRIPLKSYHYSPKGKRPIVRTNKRWQDHLELLRRNGPNGPTLDAFDMVKKFIFMPTLFLCGQPWPITFVSNHSESMLLKH